MPNIRRDRVRMIYVFRNSYRVMTRVSSLQKKMISFESRGNYLIEEDNDDFLGEAEHKFKLGFSNRGI